MYIKAKKGVINTQAFKNQSNELQNKQQNSLSKLQTLLYCNMAILGGFIAGYTILVRSGYMGGSQTTNMIGIVFAILGKNLLEFLVRFGALGIYILSLFIFVVLKNKTKFDVRLISIILNAIAIIIMGFIPQNCNPMIAIYPAFFVLPFQWSAFATIDGYVSASIFSTNNLKQCTTAIFEYLFTKDKEKLTMSKAYGKSLLSFYIGVVCCYLVAIYFKIYAIFCGLVFVLSAIFIFVAEKKQKNKNTLA